MPLKDYLNQFNPALLNIPAENYSQFKAALEKEYDADIEGANAALAQARQEAEQGTKSLTEENQRLKAANWDMWQKLPQTKPEPKTGSTSNDDDSDLDDGEGPDLITDFFKPPTK